MAHKAVRAELLAERTATGHWVGELASSPLATATAISALVLAHETEEAAALPGAVAGSAASAENAAFAHILQSHLSEVIVEGLHWLARVQNADGGWGDATRGRSNLAATLLVQAAFRLTGVPAKYADLMDLADEYVTAQGGIAGLRYGFGKERLVAAPILANCALAGMLPWRQVPTLPFEWACLPERWASRLRLPLERLEVPALVAVGHAKFHHDPPRNQLSRTLRNAARAGSLSVVERLQSQDGSFFDAIPLTAFVVMSLASTGRQHHSVVQQGVEFLLSTMRSDASWPVVGNLAVSNTTAALNSLLGGIHEARGRETLAQRDSLEHNGHDTHTESEELDRAGLDWLLNCQSTTSGGWAWSDSSGALPNTDDTAGALRALAKWQAHATSAERERIERAARVGIDWLLNVQNDDGGWPALQGGPSALGLERSAADLTGHVLDALAAWQRLFANRIPAAIARGVAYLGAAQRGDGSFTALRFGNQYHDDSENPVCGTSRVLTGCAALGLLDGEMATRAARWLVRAQHSSGGWGPPRTPLDYSGSYKTGSHSWRENEALAKHASVEETSLAVAALLPLVDSNPAITAAVSNGLAWLAAAIEQDEHHQPAVIGQSFFAKLWYHERLLPLTCASGALSGAVRQLAPQKAIPARAGS